MLLNKATTAILSLHVLLLLLVAGCASGPGAGQLDDSSGGKEAQGEAMGSLLGSMIGNFVPGGSSIAGQVLRSQGGNIGGLVGGTIGAALDEEDRRRLAAATRKAFDTGAPVTFTNPDTGVTATVTPTAIAASEGKQCRSVKQDVTLKSGKVMNEAVKGCKSSNGTWEV